MIMAFEQKDMSGVLFKNQRKESEKHPDTTGNCLIDGIEYWVNGWTKFSKSGDKFISMSFKRKDQAKAAASAKVMAAAKPEIDDEISF
jgi:hypothetical protein